MSNCPEATPTFGAQCQTRPSPRSQSEWRGGIKGGGCRGGSAGLERAGCRGIRNSSRSIQGCISAPHPYPPRLLLRQQGEGRDWLGLTRELLVGLPPLLLSFRSLPSRLRSLPPYWQRVEEMERIMNDARVQEGLRGRMIDSIEYIGEDLYRVKTDECTMEIGISRTARCSPRAGWLVPAPVRSFAARGLSASNEKQKDHPMSAYDILIIGSGPGGYVTAIRAAQLGFKTAIVEREHLGGICLNWGCIPTKALLRTAEIYHYATHAKDYGLTLEGTMTFNPADVVKRSRGVSQQLNTGVGFLLKKNKVDVIWGEPRSPNLEVKVSATKKPAVQPQNPVPKGTLGEGTYTAKNIIIATGARPRVLPGIEPDGKLIWTYFEAMVPPDMPKSLIVMGSGAIGIEFASFYKTMGADVTVVEVMPQVMPVEDARFPPSRASASRNRA